MRQDYLLQATLAALLAGAGPCAAHHDDISDPPLFSASQNLPTGLDLDAAAVAVLGKVGYIYVPDACRSDGCRLHVAFHGCRQNADAQGDERIHDDFVRDAGYNCWAAANPGRRRWSKLEEWLRAGA